MRPVNVGDGGLSLLNEFTVASSTGGYIATDDFLQFIRNAEYGVKEPGLFEGRGPLAILLLVLLGGLALNLTPCVLPMIPINLAIIGAGAGSGSRARGFLLGGVYGAAMALVYGVLGVIVIMTAGTFGTINASPWFNVAIAVIFVALALAMFDVFDDRLLALLGSIRRRRVEARQRWRSRLSWAQSRRCLPAPASRRSSFRSCCSRAICTPRAPWRRWHCRSCSGIGHGDPVAACRRRPDRAAEAGRLDGPRQAGVRRLDPGDSRLLRLPGLRPVRRSLGRCQRGGVQRRGETQGWLACVARGRPRRRAEREQKPVLVDMWATWCKNCLAMDETTLADARVKTALDGYVKIKLQAEQPDEEPARSIMARFNAVGLPTYVVLHPKTASSAPSPR